MKFLKSTIYVLFMLSLVNIHSLSAQWQQTNISAGRVNTLLEAGPAFFAGTDTGGVFKSVDNGLNWTASNNGLTNKNMQSLIFHNNRIVAGVRSGLSGAIFHSSDGGLNWKASRKPYYGYLYCLSQKGNDIFAGTWYGVITSTDTGSTWKALSGAGMPGNAIVSSIVHDETGIYAGVSYSSAGRMGVFYSAGTSWTAKNSFLGDTEVQAMAIMRTNIFVSTKRGMFKTVNKGSSWTPIPNGLGNLTINTLAVHGTDIFAGTNAGIFKSSDSGSSWKTIDDTGFSYQPVYAIAIMGNYIFAGTYTGLWRRPMNQVTAIGDVKQDQLSINVYPNPGTGVFNIQYDGSVEALEISVSDLKGRLIYIGKNERLNGQVLDLGGFAHGVYLLRIICPEGVYTRRIVIQ